MKPAAVLPTRPEPPGATPNPARAAHHISLRQLADGRWRVAYHSRTGTTHVRGHWHSEQYARSFAEALSRLLDAPIQ